jgi:hypothetical protein
LFGQIVVSKASFGKVRTNAPAAPARKQRALRALLSIDARRSKRQRTILPGKIYFTAEVPAVDCLIGDMSTLGARVRVKTGVVVPNELYLVHLREWTAYAARVAWRRTDGNIGLAFKGSYDLDGAIKPEFRVMREFCVQNRRLS